MRLNTPVLIVRCFAFFACSAVTADDAPAGRPWDEAFAGSAQAILKAAKTLPVRDADDSDTFLRDVRIEVDAEKRIQTTQRSVYRLNTERGLEDRGNARAQWSQWHQERPRIRARVISPTGEVHELDLKTISEQPVESRDALVFSDRRVLNAPLPAVGLGAIVELETVTRESLPFFSSGMLRQIILPSFEPVEKVRVSVEWSLKTPVLVKSEGIKLEGKASESDGRGKMVYEAGPFKPLSFDDFESQRPLTEDPLPSLLIATKANWSEIATAYHETIEKQIKGFDSRTVLADLQLDGKSREEKASLILSRLQGMIRYTALAFGDSAVIPYRPAEVLSRRYGDCKDQASLYVALLRAAGVEARVALISTSNYDVFAAYPALNQFNHVIVYIPGAPALWVDPTVRRARPGELPIGDQGRLALVADPKTTELLRTPRSPAGASRLVESLEYTLSETTKGRVAGAIEASGNVELELRNAFPEAKDLRKYWEDRFKKLYRSSQLSAFDAPPLADTSRPFRLRAECEGATLGLANANQINLWLSNAEILDRVPLFLKPNATDRATGELLPAFPRKHRLALADLHWQDLKYRLIPPTGFAVRELPKNSTQYIGPATLSWEFTEGGEGTVDAHFHFDTGSGEFSADEANQFIDAMASIARDQYGFELVFVHELTRLTQENRLREAVHAGLELAKQEPKNAWHPIRLASTLGMMGLNDAARVEARKAIALDPLSEQAHFSLASASCQDPFGVILRPGCDRENARTSLEKVLELNPENLFAREIFLKFMEFDEMGNRCSPERLKGILAEYRKALRPGSDYIALDYARVLAIGQQFDELKRESKRYRHLEEGLMIYTAALVMADGIPAAETFAKGSSKTPAGFQQLMLNAGQVLNDARCYTQAAELIRKYAAAAPDARFTRDLAGHLAQLKPTEERWLADEDPALVVQKLYHWMFWDGASHPQIAPLFREGKVAAEPLASLKRLMQRTRVVMFDKSPQRRCDEMARATFLVTGGNDNMGWRVTVNAFGEVPQQWYVVKTDAGYRLWDVGPRLSGLGAASLREIEAGRLDSALTYLEWAMVEDPQTPAVFDAFSGSPFKRLLMLATRSDIAELRLPATALLAESGDPPAIDALAKLREVTESKIKIVQIDRSLLEIYMRAKKHAESLAVVERLLESHSARGELQLARIDALERLDRHAMAQDALKKMLEDPSVELAARRFVAHRAFREGAFAEAHKQLQVLIKRQKDPFLPGPSLWGMLGQDPMPPVAVDVATSLYEGSRTSYHMRALAMAHAGTGQLTEACQMLRTCHEFWGLDPRNYIVQGRIAEQCGMPDAARAAYQRLLSELAEEPEFPGFIGEVNVLRSLAKLRLAALEK